MARYYDIDKLKEMIEAKAEMLINGKEAFIYVSKWLDMLPSAEVVPAAEVEALREQLADEKLKNESLESFIRYELDKEKKMAVLKVLDDLENRAKQLADELEYEETKLNPCICGTFPKLKKMRKVQMGHGSYDDLIWYECPKCGKRADGAAGTELKSRLRAKKAWDDMLLAEVPKGGE